MTRLWFKIGETATLIGVKPKDLRYWEQLIPEIRPRRSHGNLRYYHVTEIPRLQQIKTWLAEGLTVGDCRQLLLTGQLTRGLDFGEEPELEVPKAPKIPLPPKPQRKEQAESSTPHLTEVLELLRKLRDRLDQPLGTPPKGKPKLDDIGEGR